MKKGIMPLTLVLVVLFLSATLGWGAEQGTGSSREQVKETFETVDSVLRPVPPKPAEGDQLPEERGSEIKPPPRLQPEPQPNKPQSAKLPGVTALPGGQVFQFSLDFSERLAKGRFVALLIGINGYLHLDRLDNAVGDARSVAKILQELYGFEVCLLLDREATREGIMRALNELRRTLTEKDSLLIYYSGHGHYDRESDTSYWLPVDAEPDDNTRWIETRSLTDQFKLIAARQVLVVADSCFSGAMTRSIPADLTNATTRDAYLSKLLEKTTRVLIASGGNEPVVDAGASEHSIFADAFLRALRVPFAPIFTAEELMTRHLKESVAGRAEQLPEYKVIRNSGHDGGDFIFVKRR